jgi:hypothetical protein
MWLGINYVIRANHLVSLITSSTTDPWCIVICRNGLYTRSFADSPFCYDLAKTWLPWAIPVSDWLKLKKWSLKEKCQVICYLLQTMFVELFKNSSFGNHWQFMFLIGWHVEITSPLKVQFQMIFSSPDPKGHVRYCHHLASVNFSYFNLLLWNYWSKWNQTWQKASK